MEVSSSRRLLGDIRYDDDCHVTDYRLCHHQHACSSTQKPRDGGTFGGSIISTIILQKFMPLLLPRRRAPTWLAVVAVFCIRVSPSVYISPSSTCSVGCGSLVSPYGSIASALDANPNGQTFFLLPGRYTGPQNSNLTLQNGGYTLSLAPGVTDSSRAIIDCELQRPGFVLRTGPHTIRNVTMERCRRISPDNGAATGPHGGCLQISNAFTVLEGVNLTNCEADGDGGAIWMRSNSAEIRDTVVVSSSAGQRGGGLFIAAAYSSVEGSSEFRDNSAADGGSSIYAGDRNPADGATVEVIEPSVVPKGPPGTQCEANRGQVLLKSVRGGETLDNLCENEGGDEDDDDDDDCFSGSTIVSLSDGSAKAMRDVRVGDEVQVGVSSFSKVVFLPHRRRRKMGTNNGTTSSSFLELRTESGQHLHVTKRHLIRATTTQHCGDSYNVAAGRFPLVYAENVRVGMYLLSVATKELAGDKVTSIRTVRGSGQHTIVTESGDGLIVANGFVVSSFAVNHRIVNAWYHIHRASFHLFPSYVMELDLVVMVNENIGRVARGLAKLFL
eukprot:jgi/Bigna1/89673/estExt_fgenesh1_pg.C_530075